MAQGVPGRLRPQIFLTFGTTRVVGRQPNTPAAFTPGENPGTHFQRLSRPQGTWFCRGLPRKKSPVTPPGIYPGTVRLVAQRLNHYATPGPYHNYYCTRNYSNVIEIRFSSVRPETFPYLYKAGKEIFPLQAMKAYGGYLLSFLTFAQY